MTPVRKSSPWLRGPAIFLLGLAVVVPAVSRAQSQPPKDSSALLRALVACRTITGSEARLGCFEAATARLELAERSGEVVMVDREQVRAARRQAFGFNLPSLAMFSRGEKEEEVDQLSTVVERAYMGGTGHWIIRTREGQVWRQIDREEVYPAPRKGSRAEIRRALLGSYFMNIDGRRAIRVRREE